MKLLIEASALIPLYEGILEERSLGGTETAIVRISNELVKLGIDVTVRTSHSDHSGDKVRYLSQRQNLDFGQFDVCVVVQNWRIIPLLPKMKIVFWTGDGPEQYSNLGVGDLRLQNQIKKMVVTTQYHKKSLCEQSGFPVSKTEVIGNGVADFFIAEKSENRQGLIYHSAPYRGLEHLLRYFDDIKKTGSKLELNIFSDMELYNRSDKYVGPYSEILPRLKAKYSTFPGIRFSKTIPQKDLAKELKKSAIFPYPCIVPEVFCMSMLEAMAAGVVPLVSDIGGLAEVLGDADLVVSGVAGEKSFDREFCKRLVSLSTDDEMRNEKSELLSDRAKNHFKWSNLAKNFKILLEEL